VRKSRVVSTIARHISESAFQNESRRQNIRRIYMALVGWRVNAERMNKLSRAIRRQSDKMPSNAPVALELRRRRDKNWRWPSIRPLRL
jgi:hypothetical protein